MFHHLTASDGMPDEDDTDLLETVDGFRMDAARRLDKNRKSALGQFFTPAPVARLMASLLECHTPTVHLLDAGAGVGSLFAACVAQLCSREDRPEHITITAYELDESLIGALHETLHLCQLACEHVGISFHGEVLHTDFLQDSVEQLDQTLFSPTHTRPPVNCIIMNPPYKKVQTHSEVRKLLHRIGIETSNLYTGFLAVAMQLLSPAGELVAITPRSFCNGPYFKHFRTRFLHSMSLRRLHVFDARDMAFHEDAVLQENLILHAIKEREKPARITISSSVNAQDDLMLIHDVDYDQVVQPDDPDACIRIVQDRLGEHVIEAMSPFQTSLQELGITVSTGRVVDFRALEFLRQDHEPGTIPLLYPTHISYGMIQWPKPDAKKPNALVDTAQTKTLQVPNDYYVLVKRFSSKEEKKRLVAAVSDPHDLPGASVGFENHLNYFHQQGKGLPPFLAKGLAAYLNSMLVDAYFRQMNGHTQVNATDLRNIPYPSRERLEALGRAIPTPFPPQHALDALVKQEFLHMSEEHTQEQHAFDPVQAKRKLAEALEILKALGFERGQHNERSALTLLALLHLEPDTPWSQAHDPLRGITPLMDFFRDAYGKEYKPNTRETVRRQSVHQFLEAGLIVANPDDPERPVNSPKAVYRIEQGALELVRRYGTSEWETHLRAYLSSIETLKRRYAQEREMVRIPVTIAPGKEIKLSPGGQNVLVEKIVHDFAPYYVAGGNVLYVGDTDTKFAYYDEEGLAELGVTIEAHGKMPDVIIYHTKKHWLVLIEAVTSHGPIDGKRKDELQRLFRNATVGLVYVTAFLTRGAMVEYLRDISWETEVWVAEAPTHLIHFNGNGFWGRMKKGSSGSLDTSSNGRKPERRRADGLILHRRGLPTAHSVARH